MQRQLSDRLLMLKIKLALSAERLNEAGRQNFASYICGNIDRIFGELEIAGTLTDGGEIAVRLNNVALYLREIENVLLTCKVGVQLPLESSTLKTVGEIKNEILELIRREQYTRPFINL